MKRIGIIGGGIAGLGATWALAPQNRVTLFEKNAYFGGHANTANIVLDNEEIAVDTGFIVYNSPNYPNLVSLFDALKVPTDASDMSFGVSLRNGELEYSGTNLRGLLAQKRNLVRPRFWRMLADIRRFYECAPSYLNSSANELSDCSIGELLEREHYCDAFIDDHLIPMGAAIWSSSRQDISNYPAGAFIRFFENHGLLKISLRPQWRTVTGGSKEYVSRLIDASNLNAICDRAVSGVIRSAAVDESNVIVTTIDGAEFHFDEIILATHADEAVKLLRDASEAESRILSEFSYSTNRAVLHSDPSFMPQRRGAWSSWNYIQPASSSADTDPLSVTYWMNNLQPLSTQRSLFVTLNPDREPEPTGIFGDYSYTHPIFTTATNAAQNASTVIQGSRHTWFCGSYFGYGFHEDALQSGLWVADQLGASIPWLEASHDKARMFNRLPNSYGFRVSNNLTPSVNKQWSNAATSAM